MKLGLVTYCDLNGDNYGQILQAYATAEFLKQQRHDVTLLQTPYNINITLLQKVKSYIIRIIKGNTQHSDFKSWYDIVLRESQKHPRHFSQFVNKHIKYQEGDYQKFILEKYDGYISGSDQIWAIPTKEYMLGWVPKNKLKISIASSVGCGYYNKIKKIKAWYFLRRYNLITVREENGLSLCKSIGIRNAKCILDPVFLHDSSHYENISIPAVYDKPYVLVYLLAAPIALDISEIIRFAQENGLEVKYVESQGRIEEQIEQKEYPTIEEWLGLIQGASYIFTNSFHGTAFSIIFKKSFLALPLIGAHSNMNIRLESTLGRLGLKERIFKEDIHEVLKPIEWSCSDKYITENKAQLMALVQRHLDKKSINDNQL